MQFSPNPPEGRLVLRGSKSQTFKLLKCLRKKKQLIRLSLMSQCSKFYTGGHSMWCVNLPSQHHSKTAICLVSWVFYSFIINYHRTAWDNTICYFKFVWANSPGVGHLGWGLKESLGPTGFLLIDDWGLVLLFFDKYGSHSVPEGCLQFKQCGLLHKQIVI